MIDFLHLLLGYSITGDVGAQVLPFLHGQGKNSKSVHPKQISPAVTEA